MSKIIKILGIFSVLLLASCARNLEPMQKSEILIKANEDIATIEEIKKNNLNWEENLEIDLYTAIALAIKNNKELKVKLLENALANRQIDKVRFEMLPALAANAGYSGSEFYKSTTSATVDKLDTTGTMGEDYSTSANRDVLNQDIGFTWNALDFGLSYIKAGQNADRYLISEENEIKAAHNIVREVIRSYWNSMSADKMLKKYDPLLVKVNEALNDSQKIEELLLTKPMDALLYQKELLDIQRALQTQKQSFIDARIQLGTLMGLLPNQNFKLVETKEPLNVLDMTLEEMEVYALQNRPELLENHYEERISVEQTRAGILTLLPGINFNAAYTSSSNDYLQQKTNAQFGATIGANLLNVFNYPTIKKINQTNTEVIREQRLALSMTVLSQIHIANIDYKLALEEFETAQRYYEVSKKITEQVKNAQKIARFGQLEVIREQASLLVAELRYDIAFTKLQHSIGKMYSSAGINVTEENVKKMGVKKYAEIIENNFKTKGKKYFAKVKKPIQKQNPVAKNKGDGFNEFKFDDNTFELEGIGNINYSASLINGDKLPNWLIFLPSQKMFLINKSTKDNTEELKIRVVAKNVNTSVGDNFTLLVDPQLRTERIENEKKLKKERELAKKREQEEIERLKAEKILKEKEAENKEKAELLAKQKAEELRILEEKEQEELLAKQKAEELRILEEKKQEELLAKQKAEELRILEEKKQEELLAKQKARKLKLLEEKKQRELLAKQKEEEIRRITENDLLVLRDQLSFQMVGNKNETLYGALYGKNSSMNYSDKDLIEFKSIEAKINNILLNFDLDKRIDITKKIINDIFQQNPNIDNKSNKINFKTLNEQIYTERLMLDKLYDYSNKYKFD